MTAGGGVDGSGEPAHGAPAGDRAQVHAAFADAVRAGMAGSGLNQRELASKLGITPARVSQYLNYPQKMPARWERIVAVLDAAGADLEVFAETYGAFWSDHPAAADELPGVATPLSDPASPVGDDHESAQAVSGERPDRGARGSVDPEAPEDSGRETAEVDSPLAAPTVTNLPELADAATSSVAAVPHADPGPPGAQRSQPAARAERGFPGTPAPAPSAPTPPARGGPVPLTPILPSPRRPADRPATGRPDRSRTPSRPGPATPSTTVGAPHAPRPDGKARLDEHAEGQPDGRPATSGRSRRHRRTLIGVGGVLLAATVGLTAGVIALGSTPPAPLPSPLPVPAPPQVVSWTGLIHDVGPAGLAMRATPTLAAPETDRVPDGATVTVQCAVSGSAVNEPDRSSTVWLHTNTGPYISALYLSIPGKIALPNCDPRQTELSLLAQVASPVVAPTTEPSPTTRRQTTTAAAPTTTKDPSTSNTSRPTGDGLPRNSNGYVIDPNNPKRDFCTIPQNEERCDAEMRAANPK